MPLMDDPASLATVDVLTKLIAAGLLTDANLASLAICKAVNLSLEHGNCDGSCFAYVLLGKIAGPRFGDYQAGFRFGQLGYELVERRGLKRFQARTYLVFAVFVVRWTKHVRASRDLLRRAFEAANRIGDLTYAAYSVQESELRPARRRRSAGRGARRSRTGPRVRAEGCGSALSSTSSPRNSR